MLTEEIDGTVSDCIDWDKDCPDPCFNVGQISAAIATRLSEEAEADLATAQAQVAVMAEALEYTLVRLEPLAEALPNIRKPEPWIKKLKKALSAAPKVVWSGKSIAEVTTESWYGRKRPPIARIKLPDDGGWSIILEGKSIGDEPLIPDGEQVKLFVVLDKQGEGE